MDVELEGHVATHLQIRAAWMRVERSFGLVDDIEQCIERSAAALRRSRARLAAVDPIILERRFAARMDRSHTAAPGAAAQGASPGRVGRVDSDVDFSKPGKA